MPSDRQPVLRLSSWYRLGLRLLAALLVCLSASAWCVADEVSLKGGTIIQGRVTEINEAGIVLEQEDLGPLKISTSRIKSIVFDRAVTHVEVSLVGGDVLKGKILEQDETSVVLDHESLGRLEIPRLEIRSVVFEKEEKTLFTPKRLNAFSAKLKKKGWKASIDFSYNTASGDLKDEKSMRIGANAARATERTHLTHELSYYHKISRGKTSDNNLNYYIMHDWLKPDSPWFHFAGAGYNYDEFRSWEQRLSAYAGPAYHLIRGEGIKLDVRLGLGTRKEWGSQNDDYKFEAVQGLELEWDINSRQKVTAFTLVAPVVGDLDDYRARTSAEWQLSFHEDMALSYVIGVIHDYTSLVDPGDKHSDTRFHLGFRYRF